jgi:dTDP-4-dehydrorhamnose reductase
MKILILGGAGMLGHQLYRELKKSHDVKVTLRQKYNELPLNHGFQKEDVVDGLDVLNDAALLIILNQIKPDVIINAVALIPQRAAMDNKTIYYIQLNAYFPQRLSELSKEIGARLIHISTDGVFKGTKGQYTEQDSSDAEDIYGRCKFLGELQEAHTLTLRTCLFGFELFHKKSLLEWILSQKGSVKGYTNAIFSGFSTFEMGRIIETIITRYPTQHGIYHLASSPLSKYEFVQLVNEAFQLNLTIIPHNEIVCYRDLCGKRFNQTFNYTPPSWQQMINELAQHYQGVNQ